MAFAPRSFEDFAALRGRLQSVLLNLGSAFEQLDSPERSHDLATARESLGEERFRIVVMGAMKRGKSTLINALLGEELMPMGWGRACTAIPISARYGEKHWAVCHRRSGEAPLEFDPRSDPGKLKDATTIPPKEERDGPKDDAVAAQHHSFERAEVFAPNKLMALGVEVVDTPGLNEDFRRSDITWRYCRQADAVILVLDCGQSGTQTDSNDVARVLAEGVDPRLVFVVWNQIEQGREFPADFERAKREGKAEIEACGVPGDRVFFTSALEEVNGLRGGDQTLRASSGVASVRDALSTFLVHEKSTAKLLRHLVRAERALEEGFALLARQSDEWSRPATNSAAAVRQCKGLLAQSERLQEQLLFRLPREATRLEDAVRAAVQRLTEGMKSGLPEEIEKVYVSSWEAIFQPKSAIERLLSAVRAWMRARGEEWERQTFSPLAREYASDIRERVGDTLMEQERIAFAVSELEHSICGERRALNDGVDADASRGSGVRVDDLLEQIGRVGNNLSGASSGALGAAGAGLGMGAIVGAWIALVFSGPMALVVLAAVVGGVIGGWNAGDALKRVVRSRLLKSVSETGGELADGIVKKTGEECQKLAEAVKGRLAEDHAAMKAAAEAIAQEHVSRQTIAIERQELVQQLRASIRDQELELVALRREIDPSGDPHRIAIEVVRQLGPTLLTPSASGDGTLVESRAKLGDEGWARLQSVRATLVEHGLWRPEMEAALAAHWCCAMDVIGSKMTRPHLALRTMAALAVGDGEQSLPDPAAFRVRYLDHSWRQRLVELYAVVGGEDDRSYFADDEPGELGHAGERFYAAYLRAIKQLNPDETRDSPRSGTAGPRYG